MITTQLKKLAHKYNEEKPVEYFLKVADEKESLNSYLGKKIKLEFLGKINCVACDREIKKTFNNGYCYPCLQSLAECDLCIMKPELCHYDEGTCRDNDFAIKHCEIPHTVYVSLTSGPKVGITRSHQEVSRWIDQGAVKALRLFQVKRRKHAGLIEVEIAKNMADKTNWRAMLQNRYEDVDLEHLREELMEEIFEIVESLDLGDEDFSYIYDELEKKSSSPVEIEYPVLQYPEKIKSHNLDKNPLVEGELQGIKAQYLILDTGVINMRKFAGYQISFA